jgi:hypothetical protein
MPTWTELQQRNCKVQSSSIRLSDEVLVLDSRARMTPCNFVEQKLRAALSNDQSPRRRSPQVID